MVSSFRSVILPVLSVIPNEFSTTLRVEAYFKGIEGRIITEKSGVLSTTLFKL